MEGGSGVTVCVGGVWGLPQAHLSFILRTRPHPHPPLDPCDQLSSLTLHLCVAYPLNEVASTEALN